jgi:hypothetical protein
MVKTLKSKTATLSGVQPLSSDDHEALSRSAEDARQGKFATDDQVQAIFDRYRRG